MDAPPTFRPPVVQRALSLPQGTLNRWFSDGLLPYLDAAQTVAGSPRKFSFEDACTLALLKRLTDLGMSPQAASHLAQTAVDAVDLHRDAIRELIYREYPDGSKSEVTFNGQPFRPGAVLTLSIDLHVLFSDTAARLRAAGGAVQLTGPIEVLREL